MEYSTIHLWMVFQFSLHPEPHRPTWCQWDVSVLTISFCFSCVCLLSYLTPFPVKVRINLCTSRRQCLGTSCTSGKEMKNPCWWQQTAGANLAMMCVQGSLFRMLGWVLEESSIADELEGFWLHKIVQKDRYCTSLYVNCELSLDLGTKNCSTSLREMAKVLQFCQVRKKWSVSR